MNKGILLFLVALILFSCSEKKETVSVNQILNESPDQLSHSLAVKLEPKFNAVISNWNEYVTFDDFLLNNFNSTTHRQALENSKTLSEFSMQLKDSVLPKQIDDPSLKARLNLLYSESLRLEDMSTIPSIQKGEVVDQIDKIFYAFSSVNAKINAVLEQQELERLYGDVLIGRPKIQDVGTDPKTIKKEKSKKLSKTPLISQKPQKNTELKLTKQRRKKKSKVQPIKKKNEE